MDEGNIEIEKALKEFEIKSQAEEAQAPSSANDMAKDSDMPRMVRLVIKFSGGTIKEQKTAEYVLLGVAVLMLAVSFYLFFGGTKKPAPIPINTIDQSEFRR